MRLAGKVAIVTGGARGIGRAAVELFVREGARVAVADIHDGSETVDAANAAKADAVAWPVGEAVYRRTDVTEEEDFAELLRETAERWDGIDVVFNNAGIALSRPIADTTVEDFERVMAVNVRSVFLGCKLSLPYLLERGRGSVVNMSSNGGLIGRTGDPVYNASKHAVMGLTKSLALTYASHNIRYNAVCPGPIDTPMIWGDAKTAAEREERLPAVLASCPMARAGSPDEVAQAALFLASDESSFITGAGLPVDGGKAAGAMTPDRYRLDFDLNPG
jgi:NAD(P)-dependent dehydrogenase (short-subunit alcohol dehydrogenase family)